jgi:hypothetical protein
MVEFIMDWNMTKFNTTVCEDVRCLRITAVFCDHGGKSSWFHNEEFVFICSLFNNVFQ